MSKDGVRAGEALNSIIKLLVPLDEDARGRVLSAVGSFFHAAPHGTTHSANGVSPALPTVGMGGRPAFSDDKQQSPKEFLYYKQPKTDVERIACLAFYLTHYRDTPYFKTLDLQKLNTEAAQIKFSNATYAADNATKAGYLTSAAKGTKQITAWGEQFVVALPDREAALKAISQARKRRKSSRSKK